VYDLIGVSNHHGSLHSGHYIAHVDITGGRVDQTPKWVCFNDARVSIASASSISGPTAYVLFYKLKEQQPSS
jgi:ubiquitin C-terminal hydrolase